MPIRLSNLRLGIDEPEAALADRLATTLDVAPNDIRRWRILRKSLDTRDKHDLKFVYTAEVALAGDEPGLVARASRRARHVSVELYDEPRFEMPAPGERRLDQRPVVVGSGPAGLAAAYFLAEQGYRPLVVERGRAVRERIGDVQAFDAGGPHNPESNYLFGEGGAGTFSDGKLTCRASGPDVRRVLELFAECKGKPSILYDYRPHLGSNRLPAVVKAFRRKIAAMGGEYRFDCRVEDIDVADGRVRGLMTSSGYLAAAVVILAIGHSARDTYQMLFDRGVPMVPKPFQLGVRIEQPQDQVNRAQYGPTRLEEKLGAADYALVARGRTNLFSFCMCAGGQIIPSVSEPGHFCTNGMSLSRRASPFANSGLMVTLEPAAFGGDHPLAGMMLQRRYESRAYSLSGEAYLCPIQTAGDFLNRRRTDRPPECSYPRGAVSADIRELVPPQVVAALEEGLPMLDRRWRGKFLDHAVLVAPEARGSSPVRFLRDATLESTGLAGLYPIGEGAGYAGGIVSAALDGLRAAKAIINRYAPLEGTAHAFAEGDQAS
ncbi:MAG TPA: FAD-dependent oxidoreductase [Pirellulales bacterium]|nr:FAD-dependent oxidoreductase [Pirellulales bacterium]